MQKSARPPSLTTPPVPSARSRGWWLAGVVAVGCLGAGTLVSLRRDAVAPPAAAPVLPATLTPGSPAAAPVGSRAVTPVPPSKLAAATPVSPPSSPEDAILAPPPPPAINSAPPPPPPSPAPDFAGVTQAVRAAEAARRARRIAVVVYDLHPGASAAPLFSLQPDHPFRAASIIKLGVMIAAFQARADGTVSAPQFARMRPYLRRMITISDNPSTTHLIRILGRGQVNRVLAALGLKDTHLTAVPRPGGSLVGSTATAGEVAHLLARLARRELVSPRDSNEMLALLGASRKRRRIPAGIPAHPGLWVGNKTGTLNGIAHDSAIILDPSAGLAYTLAIFTEGAPSDAAGDQLGRTLSRAVYDALLQGRREKQASHELR